MAEFITLYVMPVLIILGRILLVTVPLYMRFDPTRTP